MNGPPPLGSDGYVCPSHGSECRVHQPEGGHVTPEGSQARLVGPLLSSGPLGAKMPHSRVGHRLAGLGGQPAAPNSRRQARGHSHLTSLDPHLPLTSPLTTPSLAGPPHSLMSLGSLQSLQGRTLQWVQELRVLVGDSAWPGPLGAGQQLADAWWP